jgi:hypothetical protein
MTRNRDGLIRRLPKPPQVSPYWAPRHWLAVRPLLAAPWVFVRLGHLSTTIFLAALSRFTFGRRSLPPVCNSMLVPCWHLGRASVLDTVRLVEAQETPSESRHSTRDRIEMRRWLRRALIFTGSPSLWEKRRSILTYWKNHPLSEREAAAASSRQRCRWARKSRPRQSPAPGRNTASWQQR